ncbi:MaoC family dehydratase [Paraconexibacter sp.]|uniref:MaoC family dehydratase n=1 Tax=Paraconexibacter sp. TaxID=2949640 RepID=UPI003566B09E
MAQVTINGIEELKALVGQEVGVSDWFEVSQDVIQAFADATGDQQWIHVDVDRAKAESPFGGPIAHGLLTLSLGPVLMFQIFEVTGVAGGLNYGYGKVRFPAPVPSGSKLRVRAAISSVEEVPGGVQATVTQTFEIDGGTKPVCVAEALVRFFGG